MKFAGYALLILIILQWPIVSFLDIGGTSRHVPVRIHQEHGAVLINAQKVRVPFKAQETAIATEVDGLVEFLFLNNYQSCLVTVLAQLTMSLLLIFLVIIPSAPGRLGKFTPSHFRFFENSCSHIFNIRVLQPPGN